MKEGGSNRYVHIESVFKYEVKDAWEHPRIERNLQRAYVYYEESDDCLVYQYLSMLWKIC